MRIRNLLSSFAAAAALSCACAAQQAAPAKPPAKPAQAVKAADTEKPAAAAKPAQPSKPAAPRAAGYKSLKYPPLNKIAVPEPARFELPNGMVVYLVEDHELPTVSVQTMIRAGSRWEPAGKSGLASITGTVMRTGGSVSRNGDKLDEELDRLAAFVETGIGQDSGRASVSVLKEDLDKGLDILADILQHPAFPQDKIELAKISQRDSIARRNDQPQGIVFREFQRIVYGKDSPYARITEYDTIESITRDDLVAFHKKFYQPQNVLLGAWGDFKSADMRARIEKAFGSWQRGSASVPPVPEVDVAGAARRAGFYSVNKDDMSQSWVIMGMIGGKRNDPDFYPLEVMNDILGGGFSSRLFSNVRSDQGLAYAVFSSWGAGWDRPGTFTAAGSSKPETTIKIYRSILHEIERIADGGVTDDELARSKDGILKGVAFDFDSTGKIVSRMMTYEYYGYPKDYLQQYRVQIEKVGKSDVARVAKQYLKPDRFAVLFLGKEKGYEAPVSSLGKVTAIDIAIPRPKGKELAAATPEAIGKGKTLLAAARAAMGGDAVARVKEYTSIGTATVAMGQQEMSLKTESTINVAGKMLNKMTTPMGEMVQGFDGQTAWVTMGGQTRDAPESQKADIESGFFRDTICVLQKFDSAGITVQALGPSDGLEGVAVSDPARKLAVKLYIDPKTNLVMRKNYTAAIMGPPAETDEIYSDYRDVNGVKFPFKTVLLQGGKTKISEQLTEVKINPGIAESAYKKP